jgi:hypothetical protein
MALAAAIALSEGPEGAPFLSGGFVVWNATPPTGVSSAIARAAVRIETLHDRIIVLVFRDFEISPLGTIGPEWLAGRSNTASSSLSNQSLIPASLPLFVFPSSWFYGASSLLWQLHRVLLQALRRLMVKGGHSIHAGTALYCPSWQHFQVPHDLLHSWRRLEKLDPRSIPGNGYGANGSVLARLPVTKSMVLPRETTN